MFEQSGQLVLRADFPEADARELLSAVGFADWALALRRLREIVRDDASRHALADVLPMLLIALSDAATPDASLLNFERYVQCVADRTALLRYLASKPRAVEILVKLFVGSQFLTEILLRNPDYLEKLTNHKQLADIKSRAHFVAEAREAAASGTIEARLDALRRYQRWELLRIGACDAFGLFDLKSVTVQLSLLADSLVQTCLNLFTTEQELAQDKFAVVAMGKLGGEELNYSSDIDLVFLAETDAARYWTLGQRLIKALTESTSEGFLYRVDMRLRPWGRSGALVNTIDGHVQYLKAHGMLWEKQALLKARVIAGNPQLGETFLKRVDPLLFGAPVDQIRESIRKLKARIEANLERRGRDWGEVKSGAGSIRDIEFVTQFLQLAHGKEEPHVRSINTLDGLVRLADFSFIQADEYRQLANAYTFFRTIEHSLQLMHHKQTHSLPEDRRELAFLARRLDFPDADQFLDYYNRHRASVRAIYRNYLEGKAPADGAAQSPAAAAPPPLHMEASYVETFDEAVRARHLQLLTRLTDEAPVDVAAVPVANNCWQVTVVGFNHPGELAIICGLLFASGCNIVNGNAFSEEHVSGAPPAPLSRARSRGAPAPADATAAKFVDVFTVEPPPKLPGGGLVALWQNYASELADLIREARSGRVGEVQGRLAKRVASVVPGTPETATTLYPVEVEIDNESSPRSSVLRIRSEDTMGFLYELANALALAGIDIQRMIVDSRGNRAFDTLYVTDSAGEKITDPTRQSELRATIVLIKHFTHLLPRSPNPEAALLHFRDFLAQLFQQPDWLHELASLERSDVLAALARLLGVSDFLWEDFLRLQHVNLFPVVRDISGLEQRKTREALAAELDAQLAGAKTSDERRERLNAFKDREMFRADMRHILGLVGEFGQFSAELADVAEVVVGAALNICLGDLERRYGQPRTSDGQPGRLCACALGKCGGRELGYASDIELMFVYDGNGTTTGPETIGTTEFYQRFVEAFTHTIRSREEGVFQVDLRLRPYGRAGSLAVSLDAFAGYFGPEGAAWPYERQALVKLRPIAGDLAFGAEIVALRDRLIYSGEPFDVAAMRAMREKQLRQLVKAGTTNAKLSPGQLVDTEYLVQGLQITHGHLDASLRAVNTLDALAALKDRGLVSGEDAAALREAYVFQRDLIDALRIVRGHARDLTVPAPDSEEFVFLARRLGYSAHVNRLQDDIERNAERVRQLSRLLDR